VDRKSKSGSQARQLWASKKEHSLSRGYKGVGGLETGPGHARGKMGHVFWLDTTKKRQGADFRTRFIDVQSSENQEKRDRVKVVGRPITQKRRGKYIKKLLEK